MKAGAVAGLVTTASEGFAEYLPPRINACEMVPSPACFPLDSTALDEDERQGV